MIKSEEGLIFWEKVWSSCGRVGRGDFGLFGDVEYGEGGYSDLGIGVEKLRNYFGVS